MNDELNKIQSYAFYLLNKRMMTEFELSNKLIKKYSNYPEEIKSIINLLKEWNLINDEKFVSYYLEYETNNNFRWKFWYWQKLYKKGIDKDLFEKVWFKLSPNELDMAKLLIKNNNFRFNWIQDIQTRKMKISNYLK